MRKRILSYFIVTLTAAILATTVVMALLTYSIFEKRVIDDLSVETKVIGELFMSGAEPQALSGWRPPSR